MNDRDVAEKMAQSARYSGGLAGCSAMAQEATQPMRESMTGRFRNDLSRSRNASKRASDLEELLYLLDKNPEIARILDLVDALGNKY
jgi:hypothetical protein